MIKVEFNKLPLSFKTPCWDAHQVIVRQIYVLKLTVKLEGSVHRLNTVVFEHQPLNGRVQCDRNDV